MSGDWELRGQDLDQRYGKFAKRLLSDQEIWNLAKAGIVCDGDSNIAMKLFLTSRSETMAYAMELKEWACMVGAGITRAMYKPVGAKRRRQYSEITDPNVLRQAALDGAAMAMFGSRTVPTLFERRAQFKVEERTYRKVRDFVAGVAATLIANYAFALEYAWGYVRSKVCDSIIENLSPELLIANDTFGYPDNSYPRIARGCHITPAVQDMTAEGKSIEEWQQPNTLYPSIKEDSLWHPGRK